MNIMELPNCFPRLMMEGMFNKYKIIPSGKITWEGKSSGAVTV